MRSHVTLPPIRDCFHAKEAGKHCKLPGGMNALSLLTLFAVEGEISNFRRSELIFAPNNLNHSFERCGTEPKFFSTSVFTFSIRKRFKFRFCQCYGHGILMGT